MVLNKVLLFSVLLLIMLFIFSSGCKSFPTEDYTKEDGKNITEESIEETTNKDKTQDEKEYNITESKYFEMPEEIILYNKGKQVIVKKNTETYNKIVYITNERFKNECDMAEEVVPDEFVEDIKNNKFAIEFIYTKEIQTIYTCYEYRYEKNYTKILFPLPDFRAIFGPSKHEFEEYQAGPLYISVQPESDQLIEIIEEEFRSK